MSELAIFGGRPIREKDFLSKPCVDDEEIEIVTRLMREKRFSRFVGSPVEGTPELLAKKSVDLEFPGEQRTFVGGEYVRKFEADWSRLLGVDYSISVNSATSGLNVALLAMDVNPGDEVITTPFTFTATAAAILLSNAIPTFCDIDLETFCMSPESLADRITDRTKTVVPVHWCGNAGDLNSIVNIAREKNCSILEDAAQAPNSKYQNKNIGLFGDAAVFSFNEPKNAMVGEGGMIVTSNVDIAKKCRLIRNHGEAAVDDSTSDLELVNTMGRNYRLVEILAAVGVKQVAKLDSLNEIRSKNHEYLTKRLTEEFGEYIIPQKLTHPESYHAYTSAYRWMSEKSGLHRDLLSQALIAEGIPVAPGIPRLLFEHPHIKRKIGFGNQSFPWSLGNIKEDIYAPELFPNAKKLLHEEYFGFFQTGWPNTTEDMDDIVNAIKKIMANKDELISKSKGMIKVNNYYVLGR